MAVVMLTQQLADRFGTSAVVLCMTVGGVWLLGEDSTKDEFIRAVIFNEHGLFWPVFMFLLVGDVLVGHRLWRKQRLAENAEMKRIADEKSRLQAEVLRLQTEQGASSPSLARSADLER